MKENASNKLNLQLRIINFLPGLLIIFVFGSCNEEVIVKPSAQLRLEYPEHDYKPLPLSGDCPFTFMVNRHSEIIQKDACAVNIRYPKMKAAFYLTYNKVDKNLDSLLRDAQKLAYDHTIKASSIPEQPFVNPDDDVYGMFYMINGDAATQAGFYVTDSINHFINGALYFDAKPNFDSIYPAVMYLREDMRRIIETVRWK